MDLIVGVHAVAAVLLVISGAFKVRSPQRVAAFAQTLGLSLPQKSTGRIVGAYELILGLVALGFGGPVSALLVGITFVAFAALVAAGIAAGADDCACFGRTEAPPTVAHLVLNLMLATASFLAIGGENPAEVMSSGPGGGLLYMIGIGAAAGLVVGSQRF